MGSPGRNGFGKELHWPLAERLGSALLSGELTREQIAAVLAASPDADMIALGGHLQASTLSVARYCQVLRIFDEASMQSQSVAAVEAALQRLLSDIALARARRDAEQQREWQRMRMRRRRADEEHRLVHGSA